MSWKIYPVTVHNCVLATVFGNKKTQQPKTHPPKTNPHSKSFPNNIVYIHWSTYQIIFSDDLDERGEPLHS